MSDDEYKIKEKYDTPKKGINPFTGNTKEYMEKQKMPPRHNHKDYMKSYYERNREKVLSWSATRVICECGQEVCRGGLRSHRKSKKHEEALDRKFDLIKRLAIATSGVSAVVPRSLPVAPVAAVPSFLPEIEKELASFSPLTATEVLVKVEEFSPL